MQVPGSPRRLRDQSSPPTWERACDIRRYLQSGFVCLRCSRRACFVCFGCVVDALPEHCRRRRARVKSVVAAIFRTKQLLRERCAATCHRRRRPGQARRRQGRLQISPVLRGIRRMTESLAVSTEPGDLLIPRRGCGECLVVDRIEVAVTGRGASLSDCGIASEVRRGLNGSCPRAVCLEAVASVVHLGHRAAGWITACTA
jgi:hypothetical protein